MKQIFLLFGYGLLALAITGCKGGDANFTTTAASQKIILDTAVLEQIESHQAACAADTENVCVQICHVPPGNPAAAHNKILPVQAIPAHLGHGDYLGLCQGDNTEEPPAEEPPAEEPPAEEPPVEPDADL